MGTYTCPQQLGNPAVCWLSTAIQAMSTCNTTEAVMLVLWNKYQTHICYICFPAFTYPWGCKRLHVTKAAFTCLIAWLRTRSNLTCTYVWEASGNHDILGWRVINPQNVFGNVYTCMEGVPKKQRDGLNECGIAHMTSNSNTNSRYPVIHHAIWRESSHSWALYLTPPRLPRPSSMHHMTGSLTSLKNLWIYVYCWHACNIAATA